MIPEREQFQRALEPLLLARINALSCNDGNMIANATAASIVAQQVAKTATKRQIAHPAKIAETIDGDELIEAFGAIRTLLSGHYRVNLPARNVKLTRVDSGRTYIVGNYRMTLLENGHLVPQKDANEGVDVEALFKKTLVDGYNAIGMDVPDLTADDVLIEFASKWSNSVTFGQRSGPGRTVKRTYNIGLLKQMTPKMVVTSVTERLVLMERLWEERKDIDEFVNNMRKAVAPVIEAAFDKGAKVELIEVSVINITRLKSALHAQIEISIKTLDQSGEVAQWCAYPHSSEADYLDKAAKTVANQMKVQITRAKRNERNAEAGISGVIDTITLAALRTTKCDIAEILRTICGNTNVKVSLGRRGKLQDILRLKWREGVVHSGFKINDTVRWDYGQMILRQTPIPSSVLQSMPGRSLSDLVKHEWIDPAATVRSIKSYGAGHIIRINVATVAFNAKTGEILAAS